MSHKKILQVTQQWLETFVVELNLCPFAKREWMKDRVRFVVSQAKTQEALMHDLASELDLLSHGDRAETSSKGFIETTLLIHASVLQDFFDYNLFLDVADRLLVEMQLEGVFQIASFHPDYQFAGTSPEDAQNYTNRSPFPMLHILREASLDRAIDGYPDVGEIPGRNIRLMNEFGEEKLKALLDQTRSAFN